MGTEKDNVKQKLPLIVIRLLFCWHHLQRDQPKCTGYPGRVLGILCTWTFSASPFFASKKLFAPFFLQKSPHALFPLQKKVQAHWFRASLISPTKKVNVPFILPRKSTRLPKACRKKVSAPLELVRKNSPPPSPPQPSQELSNPLPLPHGYGDWPRRLTFYS